MTTGQDPSAATVRHYLEHHAATRATRPFLVTDGAVVDWASMHSRARAVAAWLSRFGVGPGDNVIIALDNGIEFVECWFGLAIAGAVEVPINPDLVGDRLTYILNHSRARLAIVVPSFAAKLDALGERLEHLERVVVVGSGAAHRFETYAYSDVPPDGDAYVPAPTTASDIAAILYTSGSTGPPKGAMVPYGQHHANAVQGCAAAELVETDVLYLCLPLHHNMAQGYGIWPALRTGCVVRLAEKFRRSLFWDEVRSSGATVWPFVGSLLALLAARPESADDRCNPLRVAYGVPIPAALHRPFEARFGVRLVHGYGSTEVTIPVWADRECPPGAAGRVVEGYDVTVKDDRDTTLPAGTVGEICVRPWRPSTMFSGYYRNPERTDQAWRAGWFRTGDRGEFDAQGHLWFRGRAGDMIRRFGEFIDAEEVENAVLGHPDVVEAGCFGVDDPVAGQEVALAVVVGSGQSSLSAIRDYLIDRLPGFALPRYVQIVDSLPKTATGKVQRFRLQEQEIRTAMQDFRDQERQRPQ